MVQLKRLGVAIILVASLSFSHYSITKFPEHRQVVREALPSQIERLEKSLPPKPVPVVVPEPVVVPVATPVEPPAPPVPKEVVHLTSDERDYLVHLVNAEAGTDGIESKIGVANVVFNRMKSKQFPNSLYGVIQQRHQFEVVSNGSINKTPSRQSYEAVDRAIHGENTIGNCLYFWGSYVDDTNSIWQQSVQYQYDSTVFGR